MSKEERFMARFRLSSIVFCLLLFCICAVGCDSKVKAERQFTDDLDAIIEDIQVMYDEVDEDFLYWPFLYIAFADIDFDDIPEFFYGCQCLTGMQAKIWYRGYSIKDHAMIHNVRLSDWSTYILYPNDEKCSFYTGPKEFLEGYYLNDKDEPCFVARAVVGSATWKRTDYLFIEYKDSTLYTRESLDFDEALTPIKQVWMETTLETLEEDIVSLLEKYRG